MPNAHVLFEQRAKMAFWSSFYTWCVPFDTRVNYYIIRVQYEVDHRHAHQFDLALRLEFGLGFDGK